jgi:hypothetical protein
MNEFKIPTTNTSKIQREAPENTAFFVFDQPSGDASITGTPTTRMKEIATSANKAN